MHVKGPPAAEEAPYAVDLGVLAGQRLFRDYSERLLMGPTGEMRARNGPGYFARGWK